MKMNSSPLNTAISKDIDNTCFPLEILDTYSSNFPPQPGKVQIPHSPGTENAQLPVGCPGSGNVEVSNSLAY